MSSTEPYVGIVVFELKSPDHSIFREDFYIVHADSQEDAETRVKKLATEQTGDDVELRAIIDVAPALYSRVDTDIDVYSRHFSSYEHYKAFEPKLEGKLS
ncbi:TPA: DUF4288 domain-containing protein [Corynebacterium striatum]|uniref:DUF4288 domain-containing protein n=1 Tax=Corynebacterium TaxID=1716 RepID=UPI000C1CC458|nr:MULTISPECIES: DUF4288 domain-containing protein [Corynebacterium]PIS65944.1 hypothetical protein AZH44_09970 [Corynebacterium striatum]PXY05456.1 hypothetical protein CKF55_11240 [Corynebacterium striatum]PXY12436.1 hypothetical protein CKF62_13180 [Corynebacterium striatum]TXS66339.1 hypothetical protein CHU71_00375 [Corynebacterium sp. LK14]STD33797.1 Uncharacterised protein [Corynebacterium striatum]